MRLEPLELRLSRRPGPLRPQIEAAMAARGRVLRWAIMAVEGPELVLEAVVLVDGRQPAAPAEAAS